MGVLALGAFLFVRRLPRPGMASRRAWLGMGWLGVSDAMNILCFFAAYADTSVAIAVLTHYLTPIFVAVASPLLSRERPDARTFVALGCSFVGLGVLLDPFSAGLSRADALGALLGAASAVFYASNVIVNKRLSGTFTSAELMGYHALVALPVLALFVPWAQGGLRGPGALPIFLGAIGPGLLAGLAFVQGLRRVPPSHASILTFLEPVVAVMLAVLFLGESFRPQKGIGALLVLGGAALVVLQGAKAPAPGSPTATG
jgi:drug/metabolite transporter (DMT)-like permease